MTQAKLLDALCDLHRSQVFAPSAAAVAARAGVSLRTLYFHFPHLSDLHERAVERLAEQHDGFEPPPPDLPLASRIDALCGRRAAVAESLLPFVRGSRTRRPEESRRAAALFARCEVTARELDAYFTAEISALPPAARRRIRRALQLCFSTGAWERMRAGLALTPGEAEDALRLSITALLLHDAAASQSTTVASPTRRRRGTATTRGK